jgi:rhamnogalacturonan endolyase
MKRNWSLMAIAMAIASQGLQAQDLRERNYYFETLNPGHEPKPLVEGYATERIAEPLNRGLVAHRSMGYPQAPVPSYYLGE